MYSIFNKKQLGVYLKIVIGISKEEDLLGSVEENSLSDIILSDDVVNEFKIKYESIGYESSLEEFISNDIRDLLMNEIEDGKYGLFNY